MQISFQCPDCFEVHQEPFFAQYALAVRCEECALELDWHAERLVTNFERAA